MGIQRLHTGLCSSHSPAVACTGSHCITGYALCGDAWLAGRQHVLACVCLQACATSPMSPSSLYISRSLVRLVPGRHTGFTSVMTCIKFIKLQLQLFSVCADAASTNRVHQHCQPLHSLFGTGIVSMELQMNPCIVCTHNTSVCKEHQHCQCG